MVECQSGDSSVVECQSGDISVVECQSGDSSVVECQSGDSSVVECQSGDRSVVECQSGDSSMVECQSHGRGFESQQERLENFLLQGQHSVLIFISVSVLLLCYSVAHNRSWSLCQKGRWKVTACRFHACMIGDHKRPASTTVEHNKQGT